MLINFARKTKKKLFIVAIDFDGAFDRVNRLTLIKKLARFGAGTTFICCIASMYQLTSNIIQNNTSSTMYCVTAGIKQGLPLSPFLFLFYVDDIFDFFHALYHSNLVLELIHILMHADDATVLASNRCNISAKLKSMLYYCKINFIKLQTGKCHFIVINGNDKDKESLHTEQGVIKNTESLTILGTPISQLGNFKLDVNLHFDLRFKNVIKYFNFLKSNKLAPVSIKLKVLETCVMSSLLYNCETFGEHIPKELEQYYMKMIKSALGVRSNTVNDIVLIETGMLSLKVLVYCRQLNFYRKLITNLNDKEIKQSVYAKLLDKNLSYLNHYVKLNDTYENTHSIKSRFRDTLKRKIKHLCSTEDKYKYFIYNKMNPTLLKSNFVTDYETPGVELVIRFRLGSHKLPIETGRWSRTQRNQRLCKTCGILGDEEHYIFHCPLIKRNDIINKVMKLEDIWNIKNINLLFMRMKNADLI